MFLIFLTLKNWLKMIVPWNDIKVLGYSKVYAPYDKDLSLNVILLNRFISFCQMNPE
jgi:hypothetical protein